MLQNEFNGGVALYTAKVVSSEYWVVLFLQYNLYVLRVLPTQDELLLQRVTQRPFMAWFPRNFMQSEVSIHAISNNLIIATQAWTWVIKSETSLSCSLCSILLQNMYFFWQETASFEWLFKQKELNFFVLENVWLNWRKLLCGFPQSHDLK